MRGKKDGQVSVACLLNVETMIPKDHPIRAIKGILGVVLREMDEHFEEMYAESGRPSIPPERLLLSKVLMALYTIRSERQFCERLQYDLLLRWFLDLNPDEPVFDHSTFSQNQARLLEHKVADLFFAEVVWFAKAKRWISDQHFSVDATLIESWASLKSFKKKGSDDGPGDGNGWTDFKGRAGRTTPTSRPRTRRRSWCARAPAERPGFALRATRRWKTRTGSVFSSRSGPPWALRRRGLPSSRSRSFRNVDLIRAPSAPTLATVPAASSRASVIAA